MSQHFLMLLIAVRMAAAIIVRLQCKEFADFSIIRQNYKLKGFVFATFLLQSHQECEMKCLLDHRCKSINTLNERDITCELNNKTTEDVLDGVYLTSSNGWTFTTTNYSNAHQGENCIQFNPCPKGVLCKDTCDCPGYQCFPCPRGFGGLHCNEAKHCKITALGKEYRGEKNVTASGIQCQSWDSQSPHQHHLTAANFPHSGLEKNFCRNPDGESDGPWCYTTNAKKRWEYCGIKKCGARSAVFENGPGQG